MSTITWHLNGPWSVVNQPSPHPHVGRNPAFIRSPYRGFLELLSNLKASRLFLLSPPSGFFVAIHWPCCGLQPLHLTALPLLSQGRTNSELCLDDGGLQERIKVQEGTPGFAAARSISHALPGSLLPCCAFPHGAPPSLPSLPRPCMQTPRRSRNGYQHNDFHFSGQSVLNSLALRCQHFTIPEDLGFIFFYNQELFSTESQLSPDSCSVRSAIAQRVGNPKSYLCHGPL